MNYKEALHEISTMVYRNTDDFSMRVSKDCYKSIVSALEKQIPKKVIPFCRSDISVACPECGVFQDFINENTLNDKSPFCYNCGQALDWSDTE